MAFRSPSLTARGLAAAVGAVTLVAGGGLVLRADAQTPGPEREELTFVALAPDRILDTRTGIGAPAGPVGPNATITLAVVGRTLTSGTVIPDDAVAVMANATVTEATEPSFVTFYPSGEVRPNASSLNVILGENTPNMISVKLGTDGAVSIYNLAGSAQVLADIAGYYVPASSSIAGVPIDGGSTDPSGACTDGDVYLNTTTAQLFSCVTGTWEEGASIVGPVGPVGPLAPKVPRVPLAHREHRAHRACRVSPASRASPVRTASSSPRSNDVLPGVDLTLAVLQAGTTRPVGSFTASAAGTYLLEGSLDVRFRCGVLALGAAAPSSASSTIKTARLLTMPTTSSGGPASRLT